MVFRNNFNFFVIIALLCSHKVTLRIKLFANDLLYDQRNTNRTDQDRAASSAVGEQHVVALFANSVNRHQRLADVHDLKLHFQCVSVGGGILGRLHET